MTRNRCSFLIAGVHSSRARPGLDQALAVRTWDAGSAVIDALTKPPDSTRDE